MNITIVSDVYGISDNGTCVTCKNLASNMLKRGHNVTILSPFASEKESGINYVELPQRKFCGLNFILTKNGVCLAKPIKAKIIEAIKEADVVHLLLPFKTSRATLPILRELKKPFTCGFHCQAENVTSHLGCMCSKIINSFIYRRFYDKFYKFAHFVHTPSQFCADVLRKIGFINEIYVISNGVNPKFKKIEIEKPDELKDKFIIVNTGRYVKEKRTKVLIDAVKKSKHEKDIQLIILGQGPDEKKLRRKAKNLTNEAIFGYLPFQDFLNALNYGDLYVHPSEIELEGISCLEAMACGLPCIFSNAKTSSTRYFAKDERSLFENKNSDDLAKKIDYFIENPEERQKLANYYHNFSKNFEMDKAMDKMEKMFSDAISYYNNFYAKQKK